MSHQFSQRLEELFAALAASKGNVLLLAPQEAPAARNLGNIERLDFAPVSADDIREIAVLAAGEEGLRGLGRDQEEVGGVLDLPGLGRCVCSIARSRGELTAAIRLQPVISHSVEDIRMPAAMVEALDAPHGLLVFAGLVGSGKTTTAYVALQHLNKNKACHICSVERTSGARLVPEKAFVQQRVIGVDVPDCLGGIGSALRQDADVLFVSEIAGVEELQACVAAAETGHLVLVQLNAISPEAAIQRMIDVMPEDLRGVFRKALADVLLGVSVQRLLPRASGRGRVPAYGVLVPDAETRRAIAQGRGLQPREGASPEGAPSMAEDIETLLAEGAVTEAAANEALANL